MAFEAAAVRSTRPETFRARPYGRSRPETPAQTDSAAAIALLANVDPPAARSRLDELRLVDCRDVFSEARGAAEGGQPGSTTTTSWSPTAGSSTTSRSERRSTHPRCDRRRAHPPGARLSAPDWPRRPCAGSRPPDGRRIGRRSAPVAAARSRHQAAGLVARKVQSESIDADIEHLEQHNRAVRLSAAPAPDGARRADRHPGAVGPPSRRAVEPVVSLVSDCRAT